MRSTSGTLINRAQVFGMEAANHFAIPVDVTEKGLSNTVFAMANVNVTYEEMRSAATRLNAGREEINAKLTELQKLVSSLVNGGYVTDSSSKQFEHLINGNSHTANSRLTATKVWYDCDPIEVHRSIL